MPRFQVTLTHANTGQVRRQIVEAEFADDAERIASGKGWLASDAIEVEDAASKSPPVDVATRNTLASETLARSTNSHAAATQQEIRALREDLARCALFRRPVSTIAFGVVLGWLSALFIAACVLFMIFGLGQYQKYRQYWGDMPIKGH